MRDDDGTSADSPAGGGGPDSHPGLRSTWRRRICVGAAIAAVTLLSAPGSASAEIVPTTAAPMGQWVQAGAAVYPDFSSGLGCNLMGPCDPLFHSVDKGGAVEVVCQSGDDLKVRGFFGVGEDVLRGWTSKANVELGIGPLPRPCTVLDG